MASSASFDVTYREIDIELVPANFLNTSWPKEPIRLVANNYLPAIAMLSSFFFYYLVLVPHIFPALKPRTTASIQLCHKLRNAHNLLLCLYSGLCFTLTTYYLSSTNQLTNWNAILCTPVEGTWLRPLSITFTLSKLVEWIDTAFLIWLGKHPPAFLHKYHHATTFWLFLLVGNMPGPEKLGLLLNGFVHLCMYSHYYKSWPKGLVMGITVLQILQLAFVTVAWTVSCDQCPDMEWAQGRERHVLEFNSPYAMVPVYLYLFVVLFWRRFVQKRRKGGDGTKEKSS